MHVFFHPFIIPSFVHASVYSSVHPFVHSSTHLALTGFQQQLSRTTSSSLRHALNHSFSRHPANNGVQRQHRARYLTTHAVNNSLQDCKTFRLDANARSIYWQDPQSSPPPPPPSPLPPLPPPPLPPPSPPPPSFNTSLRSFTQAPATHERVSALPNLTWEGVGGFGCFGIGSEKERGLVLGLWQNSRAVPH